MSAAQLSRPSARVFPSSARARSSASDDDDESEALDESPVPPVADTTEKFNANPYWTAVGSGQQPPASRSSGARSPPPPRPASASRTRARVLHRYDSQQEGDLSITEGDTVAVIEKTNESWWLGELNGRVGLFPAGYVQELTADDSRLSSRAVPPPVPSGGPPPPLTSGLPPLVLGQQELPSPVGSNSLSHTAASSPPAMASSAPAQLQPSPVRQPVSTVTGSAETLRGFLQKKGEKGMVKSWKSRWFSREGTKLFYYDTPASKQSNGFIDLTNFSLVISPPESGGFPFQLTVPGRMYQLLAKTEPERDYWCKNLLQIKESLSSPRQPVASPTPPAPQPPLSSAADAGFQALQLQLQQLEAQQSKARAAPPSSSAADSGAKPLASASEVAALNQLRERMQSLQEAQQAAHAPVVTSRPVEPASRASVHPTPGHGLNPFDAESALADRVYAAHRGPSAVDSPVLSPRPPNVVSEIPASAAVSSLDASNLARLQRELGQARQEIVGLREELRQVYERHGELQRQNSSLLDELAAKDRRIRELSEGSRQPQLASAGYGGGYGTERAAYGARPVAVLSPSELSELCELLDYLEEDRRYRDMLRLLDDYPALESHPRLRGLRDRVSRLVR